MGFRILMFLAGLAVPLGCLFFLGQLTARVAIGVSIAYVLLWLFVTSWQSVTELERQQ